MKLKAQNNSGIILYVVLWTMVILSMLAVGIGWQTHVELTLAKHLTGKVQSKYIAISGFYYSLNLIKKYNNSTELKKPDLFNPQRYLEKIKLGSGDFKIVNLQDEESKININAINQNNYLILANLLMNLGTTEETALTIASSVVDWSDNDKNVFNPPYGAEDDYYLGVKYAGKNKPFDSIEEILLVRGMDKNIFQKIKDLITIYLFSGSLLINLDSASPEVLNAFAQSFAGDQTNTTVTDAESLVEEILDYRRSQTDINLTAEERAVEINKISLNSKEKAIFLLMQAQRQRNPQFINVHIVATDEITQASTDINATVSFDDLAILRWRRN